jgi:peptide/nickel transport system substrate-binding protein
MAKRLSYFGLSLLVVAVLAFSVVAIPRGVSQAQGFEPMSYAAPNCDYGGEFLSMEAVDQYTVKFTLCKPDPAFPSKVAFSAFAVYSSDYLEATGGGGEGSPLLDKPIGTGPYILQEWKRGDSITFQRNDNYWGTKALTPTLVFRWNSEAAARLTELEAGTVDGIDNPAPDDFQGIRENPNLVLYDRPGTNIFYIGLNNWFPPLDNVKVRQALAMGIDRQRIVNNFFPPGTLVATQFMPPSIFGYTPEVTWYDFDPEAARALLADAGFPDGFTIDLSYRDVVRSYLPEPGRVAEDIQAQLKENLNITANINVMESGAFLDASDAGELSMYLLGWNMDYPDATNFLDYHFGEKSSDQFGTKYPDIYEPLARAAQLSDPAARLAIYVEANTAIKNEVPMIPVAHGASATAFKATVEGAHASPLGNENFSVMQIPGQDTLVWMQNGEPISLYCADETDGETFRACEQVQESLLAFEVGGVNVVPALAETWEANDDLTEWTFHLRQGVTFHDGSSMDANDVIMSYAVQWDAENPLHVGRNGTFTYFSSLFGGFLNAPPAE